MSSSKEQELNIATFKNGKLCPYLIADSRLAKRLSGLTQIIIDLDNVIELINLIDTVENSEVSYALWMSAVVTYGKCFASAEGRKSKLELEHVKIFNKEAIDYHKVLISQRNEYFAHAGNNKYEDLRTCIILSPIEDGKKILEISSFGFKRKSISPDEVKMFNALCNGLLNVVKKITEDI